MNEKLIIRNFATIKEADIDIGPITVLIGPQATGKSICAKALYYFRGFAQELFNAVTSDLTKSQFDKTFSKKFEKIFPLQSLGAADFLLRYEVRNAYIQIKREDDKLNLDYSEIYTRNFKLLRKKFPSNIKLNSVVDIDEHFKIIPELRLNFYNNLKNEVGVDLLYAQLFIPAGRSFFATLNNNIYAFIGNKTLDPITMQFGTLYQNIKKYKTELNDILVTSYPQKTLKGKIDIIIEGILSGKYEQRNGDDYLRSSDNRLVSLENSSSGQQEMLPLAVILSVIPFLPWGGGDGNTVYIEEPEAHLFPTAQKKIVELIATIFNLSQIPTQFFITTHSPYLLASFNNLIHAGNLSTTISETEKEKLKKIVPEEQWIKSDNINVYSVADGKFESIKSEETGLISTNILDYVSNEIGQQFDRLLDIEE